MECRKTLELQRWEDSGPWEVLGLRQLSDFYTLVQLNMMSSPFPPPVPYPGSGGLDLPSPQHLFYLTSFVFWSFPLPSFHGKPRSHLKVLQNGSPSSGANWER